MPTTFLKNIALILYTILSFTLYSQYPGFRDVKQLYNHHQGVPIEQMFSIGEYKYLYTSNLRKMTKSIIYDDVLLWENENAGDKFEGRILIKVDRDNNYIDHMILNNHTLSPITSYNGMIYYTEYKGKHPTETVIVGIDSDFNEIFRLKTINLTISKIIVKDSNLYIGCFVLKHGIDDGKGYIDNHLVGDPMSSQVGRLVKYDMLSSEILYNIDFGHTYFFTLRGMELTRDDEVIFCGNWVYSRFCVLGDTIYNSAPYNNLNTDSYIVKINNDGTLGYLNQLHGTEGEGIYKMKLDKEDNVYLYNTTDSDSLFYNDSLVRYADVGESRFGLMKLSKDGDLQWYNECNRMHHLKLSEFQEIDNELFLIISHVEGFVFNEHIIKGDGTGVVIFILDKETGKVLDVENINNNKNDEAYVKYPSLINGKQLTYSIGIYGSPTDSIEFDNGVKIKYGNTYSDGGTFVFNIDRSIVNNIEVNNHISEFIVLPNPVSRNDILYITTEDYVQGYRISLYNNNGQKIYTGSNSKMIDLAQINNIESGIYHLMIETDKEKITKKIIIH